MNKQSVKLLLNLFHNTFLIPHLGLSLTSVTSQKNRTSFSKVPISNFCPPNLLLAGVHEGGPFSSYAPLKHATSLQVLTQPRDHRYVMGVYVFAFHLRLKNHETLRFATITIRTRCTFSLKITGTIKID